MMQRRFSCIANNANAAAATANGSMSASGSGAATPGGTPAFLPSRSPTPTAAGAFGSARMASVQARARSLRRTSAQESVDSAFQLLAGSSSRRKGSADACVGQLQPDLYRRRGSVISVGSAAGAGGAPAVGRVQLHLSYDHSTSDLVVRLVQMNVPQAHAIGACRLRLSTSHNSGGVAAGAPAPRGRARETHVLVFDALNGACCSLPVDAFKLPLGYTDLADASLQVELLAAADAQSAPASNDATSTTASCTRHAQCTVPLGALGPSADDLTVWADLERTEEATVRGELLLCLQYLPAAERLTLSVHQACNLRVSSVNGASASGGGASAPADVFVRAQLVGPDDKVLKRRKSGARKWTQEPVWDEVLSFEADTQTLPRCRLEVQLVGSDRFGRGERLIGQVQFCSPDARAAPATTRASVVAARLWRDALQRRWSVPRWVTLETATVTAPSLPAAVEAGAPTQEG